MNKSRGCCRCQVILWNLDDVRHAIGLLDVDVDQDRATNNLGCVLTFFGVVALEDVVAAGHHQGVAGFHLVCVVGN